MPKQISTASATKLSKSIADQVCRVYVNGSSLDSNNIVSYSYSMSIDSGGQASLTLLSNTTTDAIDAGDSIQIKEGFSTSELFNRFYGTIYKVQPTTVAGKIAIQLECNDGIRKLSELDINIDIEAGKTWHYDEQLAVDFTAGVDTYDYYFTGEITTVNATTVVYTNDNNEGTLSTGNGFQYLYNFDRKSWRLIVDYDTGTNTITTETKSDSWAAGDWISNKIYHSLFKLANSPIDDRSIVFRAKHQPGTDYELEYPDLSKKTVYPASGQVLFDTPIFLRDFYILVDYEEISGSLNVEDVIYNILNEADGYGSVPSDIGYDLTANYQDIEGAGATDSLVGSGTTWYTRYNNITSSLGAGDFSITGSTYAAFDPVLGKLITNGSASSVTCTTNYAFKTIQATGQSIPYAYFNDRTTNYRIDAINQIKTKVLTPNYKFFTLGTAHLFGNYLTQNMNGSSADLRIYNPTNIRYFSDSEVYTRVKLFAQKDNPDSAMVDSFIYVNGGGKKYVEKEELTYVGPLPNTDTVEFNTTYPVFGVPGTDDQPILYIDGVAVKPDNSINTGTITITDNNRYDYFYYQNGTWFFKQNYGAFAAIDDAIATFSYTYGTYTARPSDVPYGETNVCSTLMSTEEVESVTEATIYYMFSVDWSYDRNIVRIPKEAIDFDLFYDRPTGTVVPIYKDVKLSYNYYINNLSSGGTINAILGDMNPYTAITGQSEVNNLFTDRDFITVVLDGVQSVDEIHIAGGMYYPNGFTGIYPTGFAVDQTVTVKYSEDEVFCGALYEDISSTDTTIKIYDYRNYDAISNGDYIWIGDEKIQIGTKSISYNPAVVTFSGCSRAQDGTTADGYTATKQQTLYSSGLGERQTVRQDVTYSSICTELENFTLGSNETKVVTRETLGDSFQAASFQIRIDTTKEIEITLDNGKKKNVYAVSISEFLLYKNSFIKADCSLASSGVPPYVYIDSLGLSNIYGDKIFKKEFSKENYFTEEELQNAAYHILGSFYKNQSQVSVDEMWLPNIFIGQTVTIYDEIKGGDYTTGVDYFVESISGSNNGGKGSHTFQAARYE